MVEPLSWALDRPWGETIRFAPAPTVSGNLGSPKNARKIASWRCGFTDSVSSVTPVHWLFFFHYFLIFSLTKPPPGVLWSKFVLVKLVTPNLLLVDTPEGLGTWWPWRSSRDGQWKWKWQWQPCGENPGKWQDFFRNEWKESLDLGFGWLNALLFCSFVFLWCRFQGNKQCRSSFMWDRSFKYINTTSSTVGLFLWFVLHLKSGGNNSCLKFCPTLSMAEESIHPLGWSR